MMIEKRRGVCSCECGAHQNEIDRLRDQVQTLEKAFEERGHAFQDAVNKALLERDHYESLAEAAGKMAEALERISNVSQFGRDGGPIVTSEHYEAAWLDCVEIAKEALANLRQLEKADKTKLEGTK